ncbi:MAG: UDP-glucose 4-epimerase GalE [Flavobacteriales bacterium]|nr:UDP-glucose 4-epimerase GalE [Flavobacteriales bacterium]
MKIIVTGGAGFIGSHTVVDLLENGFEPIIVDDFRNSKPFILDNIKKILNRDFKSYDIDCGDVDRLRVVFEKEKPDGIIHFAADKAVNESVIDPLKYYHNNITTLVNVLKVVALFPIKSFVFSSSCTVYGVPKKVPVSEKSPIQPAFSPYGFTKQVGEQILKDFAQSNPKTAISLLRYFNPIGAHPSGLIGELPLGVPNNLIPFITQTAIGIRKSLTVNGDDYETPDGTCIRDYIHVVDLASAHVLALKNSKKQKEPLVVNIGTGKGSSVLEVINSFEKVNGVKLNYSVGPRRGGDAPSVYADNSLVKKMLGWENKFNLDDALKHAWQWEKNLAEQ